MILKDRIYGKYKVTSPIIKELIKSKSIQRLKKISQFGVPNEFYHLNNFYRFEHCVGVLILLQKLGASENEQIAGLLHDASHTAFSHVIDWVIGLNNSENYQDKQHFKFIKNSEIAQILKKNNLDTKEICDYKNFKLLENEIPNICADRIDYSLREFPIKIAKDCFKNITNVNGKIVFKNQKVALLFAKNFLKRQDKHWGGFEAVSRYAIFSKILKYSLLKKYINNDDFLKDDSYIIKKLKKINDNYISKILKILRKKSLKHLPKSNIKYNKKFRYVDPEYISKNKKIILLSTTSNYFKKLLSENLKKNKKGIVIPKIK